MRFMKQGFTVSRTISALQNLVGGGRLSQRKNLPGSIRMMGGFTLIELMIAISITSVLVTIGVSAYGKARERQIGQNALEVVLTNLNSNQSIAQIGKKDCAGKFIGQVVEIDAPATISSYSLCESGSGAVTTSPPIDNIIFTSDYTITFNPLSLGINLGGGSTEQIIQFTSVSGTTYQIKLTSSGTIEPVSN